MVLVKGEERSGEIKEENECEERKEGVNRRKEREEENEEKKRN